MKWQLAAFAALGLAGLALGAQATTPDSFGAEPSVANDSDPEDAPQPTLPPGSLETSVGAIKPELADRYVALVSALLAEAEGVELTWKNTIGLEEFAVDVVRSPALLCGTVRRVDRVVDVDGVVFFQARVEADDAAHPEERREVTLALPAESGVDVPPTGLETGSYVIVPGFRRGEFQITIGQVYSTKNDTLAIAGLRLDLSRVKALLGGAT